MPKISTRVTFDKKAAAARIRAVANDALTVMGNQALSMKSRNLHEQQKP